MYVYMYFSFAVSARALTVYMYHNVARYYVTGHYQKWKLTRRQAPAAASAAHRLTAPMTSPTTTRPSYRTRPITTRSLDLRKRYVSRQPAAIEGAIQKFSVHCSLLVCFQVSLTYFAMSY